MFFLSSSSLKALSIVFSPLDSFWLNLHFWNFFSISDVFLSSVTLFLDFFEIWFILFFVVLSHLMSFSTFQNRLQFSPILWTLYVFLVSLYYYILYLSLFFLIISSWAWPTSFSVAYLFWGTGGWFKMPFLIELSLLLFLGTLQKCAICFLKFLGFAPFFSLILILSFFYPRF